VSKITTEKDLQYKPIRNYTKILNKLDRFRKVLNYQIEIYFRGIQEGDGDGPDERDVGQGQRL
jgi:hypothetical protein